MNEVLKMVREMAEFAYSHYEYANGSDQVAISLYKIATAIESGEISDGEYAGEAVWAVFHEYIGEKMEEGK